MPSNSLRSEIAKICEQHFPIATVKAELEGNAPKSKLMETIINHEVNKVINRVVDEILALIESKMPKKLRLSTKHQEYQDGHNDCLDEVKSILRGKAVTMGEDEQKTGEEA